MTGELYINGKDAYTEYGMSLEDGAISALLTPPSLKEFVENESRIENGKKIIVGYPVYDSRDVSLPFHIVAPTKDAFFAKYQALCDVLQKGIIKIKTKYQADTVYKFVYNSCTQFSQYCFGIAKFTLKLTEANPADRTGELYSEGVIPGSSEGTSHEGVDMAELTQTIETLLKDKLDKTAVKNITGESTTDTMSQKAITDALSKKQDTLKAGTGISITSDGTVNNTKPAATVVQNTGTSESYVMSQKAVTNSFAIGSDIYQPTNVTLQGTKSIELSDKQVELLEARDVISIEVCAQNFDRNNNYNKTTAMQYFGITLGDKNLGSRIKFRYNGIPAYRANGIAASGTWQNVNHDMTCVMGYDRWIMVIDRKKGRIAMYDRPGSLIQEETDEELYKADTWFNGVKCIGISADNTNLFALRIYDHDISLIDRTEQALVQKKEIFADSLLPYSYPSYYNNSINVANNVIESSHWLTYLNTKSPLPYRCGIKDKVYKDDEGLHMISDNTYSAQDSTSYFSCADYALPSNALSTKCIFKVTFKVKQGSVKFVNIRLVNSGALDSDENTYTENDTLGVGTYTLEMMTVVTMIFCVAAEPNTEVVLVKTEYYVPRLVVSLDCHTVFKNKVYDAIWNKWYESKVTDGFPTVDAWTFSNELYGGLSPNTLSKPARRGDMKIDEDGNIYIGVVNGATQVWKKVNNA